jgi:hypothetical protein
MDIRQNNKPGTLTVAQCVCSTLLFCDSARLSQVKFILKTSIVIQLLGTRQVNIIVHQSEMKYCNVAILSHVNEKTVANLSLVSFLFCFLIGGFLIFYVLSSA